MSAIKLPVTYRAHGDGTPSWSLLDADGHFLADYIEPHHAKEIADALNVLPTLRVALEKISAWHFSARQTKALARAALSLAKPPTETKP